MGMVSMGVGMVSLGLTCIVPMCHPTLWLHTMLIWMQNVLAPLLYFVFVILLIRAAQKDPCIFLHKSHPYADKMAKIWTQVASNMWTDLDGCRVVDRANGCCHTGGSTMISLTLLLLHGGQCNISLVNFSPEGSKKGIYGAMFHPLL
jgi:hypothetical protein